VTPSLLADRLNILSLTPKVIEGFNQELTDLYNILSPLLPKPHPQNYRSLAPLVYFYYATRIRKFGKELSNPILPSFPFSITFTVKTGISSILFA